MSGPWMYGNLHSEGVDRYTIVKIREDGWV